MQEDWRMLADECGLNSRQTFFLFLFSVGRLAKLFVFD